MTSAAAVWVAALLTFGQADSYWCPMHPNIRSASADRCPLCSMTLVRVPPPVFGHYRLDVTQMPRTARPGIRALRLDIRHPQTGDRVTALTETHERLLHLFIVRRDLSYYAHVHPEPSPGGFEVAVDLDPGAYVVIADFIPAGGAPQMIQRAIVTPGFTASPFAAPPLTPDTADKVAEGLRVSLSADARAGKPATLRFTVRDAATGAPVTDLEPYLGATGHLLVVNTDVTDAIHAHPEGATIGSGPDVVFAPVLPAAGMYKMWVQFQRRGAVVTVPFVVAVQ